MPTAGHLVRRFLGSLRPGGPGRESDEWARSQLLDGEVALWQSMPGPDRRHSMVVARRVERALGEDTTRPVLAAALLHDVGKTVSGLRTFGRVVATLVGRRAGAREARAMSNESGRTRRIGLYLRHAELGADLLAMVGSDPLTVTWTREHHQPPETWTIERTVGLALKSADDA